MWKERGGRPQDMPPALRRKPEIPAHLAFYWRAFEDLVHDRQYFAFGGASAIPYAAISAWARDHGVRSGERFERLLRLVRALDRVWRAHQRKQAERETKR